MPFVLHAIFGAVMVAGCTAEHPDPESREASMPPDRRDRAAATRHFDSPGSSS